MKKIAKLENDSFGAVTLLWHFQVHRALLAATSDYFRVMFKGVMAESKQDTVDLKGVSADGLQQVLLPFFSFVLLV